MTSREFALEILRKSVHLVSILIVLIYEFFGKEVVLWVLMLFLVVTLILDYLRIEHEIRIPFFYIMYRKVEANRFGGHIFFALGAISVIALFSQEITYAAILMATFGDLAAALIGKILRKEASFSKGL